MQTVLIILAAISGSVVIGALSWPLFMHLRSLQQNKHQPVESQLKYSKRDRFMNTSEKQFLDSLNQVLGKDLCVYPQVRLASLLKLQEGKESDNPQLANYIRTHAVDFLVCDANSQQPFLVILMRNTQDQSEKARLERAQLEEVLAGAKLAVLPISHQHIPNSLQLAQSLKAASITFLKQQADAA